MSTVSLAAGGPVELADCHAVCFLGTGGPRDPADMGDPQRCQWCFAAVAGVETPPPPLAYASMPTLMAFMRCVNAKRPFTVPTEALRVTRAQLTAGVPAKCLLDPEPAALLAGPARWQVVERRVPELWAGRPS